MMVRQSNQVISRSVREKRQNDPNTPINVENLLDAFVAIYHDCNLPILKKLRNVDQFLQKYESVVNSISNRRMRDTDFDMIKVIGRGAYGEVQLVRSKKDRQVYAMKRLEKSEMIRRYDSAFFWEERDIMAHAKSEWIVQLHYAFQDARFLYMVMEFMPGGDLVNLISKYDITEEWARFYLAELVLALDAIHSFGYIHRDVKPDNMLISRSGHVKLADFGTCVKLNADGKIMCATAAGTPDYISPEVLNSQCSETVYGKEVDYWSVGIILYEMLVGEAPFYADSLMRTYQRIQNYETELSYPDDIGNQISNTTKDLIRKLLSGADVRLGRNGATEVKSHLFFQNSQWNFDTIKNAKPPYVPTLESDDDTSNFEDVSPREQSQTDNFQLPKAFNGNQLPFIGFTYSSDLSPALAIQKLMINCDDSEFKENGYPNGDAKENTIADEKHKEIEKKLKVAEIKIVELQKDIDEKTNEWAAKMREWSQVQSRQEKEKREQTDKAANAESKLAELQRQVDEINGQLRTERQDIASAKEHYEEDRRSLQSVIQQKDAQLNELKQKLEEQINLLTAERQEQAENLRKEQVGSQSGLEAKISKLAEQLENQRQAEERTRSELWALREEKQGLENNMQIVAREKTRLESRLSTLKEEYNSEQQVCNMYKAELDQAKMEIAEKIRQLSNINSNLASIQAIQDKLQNEHIARKIAEHSLDESEKEKYMLQQELNQCVSRHGKELDAKNNKIKEFERREKEMDDQIKKLLDENNRLKHSQRSVSGPIHHHAERSTDSLSNNSGSQASLASRDGLENMTREDLIARCRREMQLKENVIAKLYTVGQMKGIAEGPQNTSKARKQKNEIKRLEEIMEQKHRDEIQNYRKSVQEHISHIQYLNEQLYEEQSKKEQLQMQLSEILSPKEDGNDRRVLQSLRHIFDHGR
ncbi:unnamed protein product [Bursaphelenchus xylophilus]|uniref:non-specific serine/threonine protein kinase n=1 Tax=Bursaphelenchus xylophilus TaxID=6326 RepID=A0A7I8X2I6_BURXY|nr:unnamed protein product [Bursaphelenchus xylophilus]CAG9130723.1 unnamed protein product [Bursaphelenchus xylophilus]